ncbi:MAG: hypothetical protein JO033_07965 [Acidobacteriaceae bacterium]|nr:hypothetical protein [Acidobacteriaceae bacterium]
MQLYKLTSALLALASLGSADTIQLKAGTTLTGTYMGGSGRDLRFAVGDQVKTYKVDDVRSITFGDDAATASGASAQLNRPASPTPMVAADTKVYVRLIDPIDSKKDHVGQTFRAALDRALYAVNGTLFATPGTDCLVVLVEQQQAGHFTGQTQLSVALQSMTIANQSVDLASTLQREASASQGARSAETIGGATAIGAVIGALAGGGTGAGIGAGSGAAAGTLTRVVLSGPRVRIPAETKLQFALLQPIHQPSGSAR